MQATSLLRNNLENAKASLEVLVGDLQFLRDQVTITQVPLSCPSLLYLFVVCKIHSDLSLKFHSTII